MVKYYNLPETYYEQGFGEYIKSVQPGGQPPQPSFWKRLQAAWNDFLDWRPNEFKDDVWACGGY